MNSEETTRRGKTRQPGRAEPGRRSATVPTTLVPLARETLARREVEQLRQAPYPHPTTSRGGSPWERTSAVIPDVLPSVDSGLPFPPSTFAIMTLKLSK